MQSEIFPRPKQIIIGDIRIKPDRQRKDLGDLSSLKASIQAVGLLNPITVSKIPYEPGKYYLVAGERRLRVAVELGWATIPAMLFESLPLEIQERIELEENIKRKQLDWQEEAKAIHRYCVINPHMTLQQVADELALSIIHVSRAKAFVEGLATTPEIASATNLSAAANIVKRKQARELDALLEDAVSSAIAEAGESDSTDIPSSDQPWLLQNISFFDWAPNYRGPRFNLVHCDFPYGINMDSSPLQGSSANWKSELYHDSKDLYFSLIDCFIENKSKFLADSAHVIFWFSMNYYQQTVSAFTKAGFNVCPFPFVWGKSDGKSFIPDPARWPRRGYETALIMSIGDRKIVRSANNIVWEPTTKEFHISEKPMPVVRHIMKMYCDETSRVLDPTCGSGSALAAALELKASSIVGLEIDPQHLASANVRLKRTFDEINNDILKGLI